MTDWPAEVDAATTTAEVAAALGLTVRRRKFLTPPCCNDQDPRGAAGIPSGNPRLWCCKCGAKGNMIQLVALALTGQVKPADWAPVRGWFAARGWCSGPTDVTWTPPPPRPPPPELPYPENPRALLALGCPVGDDPAVAAYWSARGFGSERRAACALPARAYWPEWWGCGFAGLWRLAVPAYDAQGEVRSVHARAIDDELGRAKGKTRWPKGCRSSRLLFADPLLGVWLLRGQSIPERVVVVEGLTDYLALCSLRLPGWAILGAAAGGFAALAEVRFPPGCDVVAGTDGDAPGEAYAREIVAAVPGARRVVARGKDWAEDVAGGVDVAALLTASRPAR